MWVAPLFKCRFNSTDINRLRKLAMELDEDVLRLAHQSHCKSFEDLKIALVAVKLQKVRQAEWKEYLSLKAFRQAVNCFSNEVKIYGLPYTGICLYTCI